MKKMIMLVVALFLTAGVAFADGNMGSKGTTKCGDSKKEIKNNAHMNSSNNMDSMKSPKEVMNKDMPLKEMKKVGSCGTGKCGDSK